MGLLSYQPTRSTARWAKGIALVLSLLSLLTLFLSFYAASTTINNRIYSQIVSGTLCFFEIFLIALVIFEVRRLLPIGLGYTICMLIFYTIVLIFVIGFAVKMLISDEKPEEGTVPSKPSDLLIPGAIMAVLVTVHFIRVLSVLYVYRWSKMSDVEKSAMERI